MMPFVSPMMSLMLCLMMCLMMCLMLYLVGGGHEHLPLLQRKRAHARITHAQNIKI